MSNEENYFYEFGPFRIDPVKRRLLREGEIVPLTPKAFDTLLVLVENSGRTIEKDDLIEQVWPETVVEENNLNQKISILRKIFGDTRNESRYITTIPGIGYRFVAEVKRVSPEDEEVAISEITESRIVISETIKRDEEEKEEKRVLPMLGGDANATALAVCSADDCKQEDENAGAGTVSRGFNWKIAASVTGMILLAAMVYLVVITFIADRSEKDPVEIFQRATITRLTRTGATERAAISPDGRHVVYSLKEGGRESLWLRQVSASSLQQILPPEQVRYAGLTFSRDGNHIYFVKETVGELARALYRVPALGGIPTRLLTDIDEFISLSPDDSQIAFIRNSRDESALMVANSDGTGERKIAARPSADYFKVPAFSPDGTIIACSVGSGDSYEIRNHIVAVSVKDGSQKPVTSRKWAWTRWVEWLADGSGLLITAREDHTTPDQIWHLSYPAGEARMLVSDSKAYFSLSLTADSRTLAAVQIDSLSEIWVAPQSDSARARKIISGTGAYGDICYLPDGRILYASQASGNMDIWVMNGDGTDQRQLTADSGVNLHQIGSPDGRFIVFASTRAGVFNIWRMNSDGTSPVQLTRGNGEKFPQCSPDGKWVVYNSVAPDESLYTLWKVSIEGGEPVRLTPTRAYPPAISPDGKRIAYLHRDQPDRGQYTLVVIPFEGGQPEKRFDVPRDITVTPLVRWTPDGQALTYAAVREGIANIWIQGLDGGEARQLTDFKLEGRLAFDWSRDGKQLVLSRRFWTYDMLLMTNLK